MRDSIKRKIDLCIEFRDAFTNKTVGTDDVRVWVNGCMPISRKEQRYYIFQDLQTEQMEVYIKSRFYEDRHCQIAPDAEGDGKIISISGGMFTYISGILMLSINLYPNKKYVIPTDYVRREYRTAPFEEIRVIKNAGSHFLLAEDYDGGEWIQLMVPGERNIEGVWLRIQEGDNSEDFMLLE
ncbi:MAG: hypothetical protein K2H34_00035, partial [Lachnospiraceae bacterium]|nr:hypothetical protein [Lachnospiraceae bacterium]